MAEAPPAPRNLGDLTPAGLDPKRPFLIEAGLDGAAGRPVIRHGEAIERQRAVGRALLAGGLRPGQRVAILANNRPEYLDAYFGTMRAGLVSVPVNIRLPEATIRFVIEDCGAALAFVEPEFAGLLPPGLPAVAFGPAFERFLDPGPLASTIPAEGEVAMVLYTSGSTGRPKGVALSHAGQAWALATRCAITPDPGAQRYLIAAPLYHMNALFNAKMTAATGASAVLMPRFHPRGYLEAAARFEVTALTTIPPMMAKALKEEDLLASLDLSRIRRIGLGSAPCTAALRARIQAAFPGARVALSYGTTEAGPAVFGPHPAGIEMPPMALGHPLSGSEVRLVGGASPEEGVLEMRNPALMERYLNLPEATQRALREGWYHSGDLMRRDAEGFYYFLGRADDMFVCNGENVFPAEVEKLLEAHPGVLHACVVPRPDDERGQVPVAFVVQRPGATLDEAEVKRHALAGGPAYQHPRSVHFLPELPLAGTNKIDRRLLAAEAARLAGAAP